MWLDIVPFGGVEIDAGHPNKSGNTTVREIAWPPDHAIRMNVAGFAEARTEAMTVRVATALTVPVASLSGQAMLKIIAWRRARLFEPTPGFIESAFNAFRDGFGEPG